LRIIGGVILFSLFLVDFFYIVPFYLSDEWSYPYFHLATNLATSVSYVLVDLFLKYRLYSTFHGTEYELSSCSVRLHLSTNIGIVLLSVANAIMIGLEFELGIGFEVVLVCEVSRTLILIVDVSIVALQYGIRLWNVAHIHPVMDSRQCSLNTRKVGRQQQLFKVIVRKTLLSIAALVCVIVWAGLSVAASASAPVSVSAVQMGNNGSGNGSGGYSICIFVVSIFVVFASLFLDLFWFGFCDNLYSKCFCFGECERQLIFKFNHSIQELLNLETV
jgi:hypothetical protein